MIKRGSKLAALAFIVAGLILGSFAFGKITKAATVSHEYLLNEGYLCIGDCSGGYRTYSNTIIIPDDTDYILAQVKILDSYMLSKTFNLTINAGSGDESMTFWKYDTNFLKTGWYVYDNKINQRSGTANIDLAMLPVSDDSSLQIIDIYYIIDVSEMTDIWDIDSASSNSSHTEIITTSVSNPFVFGSGSSVLAYNTITGAEEIHNLAYSHSFKNDDPEDTSDIYINYQNSTEHTVLAVLFDAEETTGLSETDYYTAGSYVIPKSINCYVNMDYCDMVFGWDFAAYSRALTEEDPEDQDYPNWAWWWPDMLADEPIFSHTLRQEIEYGFVYYTNFQFETPTSTTEYILEIQDPGDPYIGSSSSFVVDVNLIGTSTPNIMTTCMGECDEGFFGEIFCGLKKLICFLVVPSSGSTIFINSSYEKLKGTKPFSYITDITGAMRTGIEQEDDRSSFLSIPMITATGTIYMLPILTASSVPALIGEENTETFRNSIVWFLYISVATGIGAFLIISIKK